MEDKINRQDIDFIELFGSNNRLGIPHEISKISEAHKNYLKNLENHVKNELNFRYAQDFLKLLDEIEQQQTKKNTYCEDFIYIDQNFIVINEDFIFTNEVEFLEENNEE